MICYDDDDEDGDDDGAFDGDDNRDDVKTKNSWRRK